jgi:hypothetical protein
MTTQEATLVAAVIAAIASVLKLVFDRYAEGRSSTRQMLQPLIAEMGEAVYSVVATSTVLVEAETPQKFKSWYAKACREREKLKILRPKLRYPLWGIDEGLRVLQRLPDWCSHARADRLRATKMLKHASSLRHAIDVTALRCYQGGRQPRLYERLQVRFHAWRCRRTFTNGGPREPQ